MTTFGLCFRYGIYDYVLTPDFDHGILVCDNA